MRAKSGSFAGTVPKGGKTLSIRTPDGYTVAMQHLASFKVRKGDAVSEGQLVATVGTSGEPDWPQPYVYLPLEQRYAGNLTLVVRAGTDPAVLLPTVEREVRALDKQLPWGGIATLRQVL